MAHFPLPWRVQPHDNYMPEGYGEPIEIVAADNRVVACNTAFYPTGITADNAALIVACVNTSALTTEPAAPEGRQDDEPRAYIVHAPEDDYYGTGPDRLQFHPLAQHDLDNGYRQTPLYDRPAEQAVTEVMVEAAVQAVRQYTRDTLFIDEHRELVRAALKAAMEAGR